MIPNEVMGLLGQLAMIVVGGSLTVVVASLAGILVHQMAKDFRRE